ncbi:MAG: hypothetical protein ABI783_08680 [Actinomycetota bacterium]
MALAVTVDLGWPWWVTTIIAVAVALAAAIAFFLTGHPVGRGILATLAVQAVVIAGVAPAIMDDGSGSMSAMQSSARLTKAEFARRADATCTRLNEFAATLGDPTTLSGTAKMLDGLIPTLWNAWMQQGLLRPPPEERPVVRRWMTAMRSYASSLEGVRYAARRGDQEGMNAANGLVNRHAQEGGRLSSQLGMKVCFH